MRSDLIAAAMIHRWLSTNLPDLLDGWGFQTSPELEGFVDRVKSMMSGVDSYFVSQGLLARTAIELWNLRDVVLLGGGMPTPLTPLPQQIMYYTDNNPEVVKEVAQMGYNTRLVDVKNVEDLKTLTGGKAAIATGLFHFLDDDSVKSMFSILAEANFHTLIFNAMDPTIPEEVIGNWTKMGYKMVARAPEKMPLLLVSGWRLADSMTIPEFFKHNQQIGAKVSIMQTGYQIYRLVRD